MESTNKNIDFFDKLPSLFLSLERNNYVASPKQWAFIYKVLEDLDNPEYIGTYISSIIAKSPKEQREILKICRDWENRNFKLSDDSDSNLGSSHEPNETILPPSIDIDHQEKKSWIERNILIITILIIVTAGLIYAFYILQDYTIIGTLFVAVASIIGYFIRNNLGRYFNKNKIAVRQERAPGGDFFWDFKLPPYKLIYFGNTFQSLAKRMRDRMPSTIVTIDIQHTVKKSIQTGGLLTPVYKIKKERPDFLFLIDFSNENNHRALLFDAWYQWLQEQEIHVERFYYQTNPRVVWNNAHPDGVYLDNLSEQYSASKLFILGDAWRLLKPQSGDFTESAHLFADWKDRFILTPISFDKWTWREQKLEELFKVVPFNESSIAQLEKYLNPEKPILLKDNFKRFREESVLNFDEDNLADTVTNYFSPFMQEWLAALSFFPELNWNLTLFLGKLVSEINNTKSLLTFENLRSLTRIYWFYNGFIPENSRELLYGFLSKEKAQIIHAEIAGFLEEQLKNKDEQFSKNRDKVNLQILLHKAKAREASKEELKQLKKIAKDEEQDFLVARYTSSPKPWEVELPKEFSFLVLKKEVFKNQIIAIGAVTAGLYLGVKKYIPSFNFEREENLIFKRFATLFRKLFFIGGRETYDAISIVTKIRKLNNKSVIVFINGGGKDVNATWGDFPKLIVDDKDLSGWDIISLGFNAGLMPDIHGTWNINYDIERLALELEELIESRLVNEYEQITILAHSLGGLIVQSALLGLSVETINSSIDSVLLFGTPSNGLIKSKIGNTQIALKQISENSSFIKKLRKEWDIQFGNEPPFSFLAIAGDVDEFVPFASSLSPFAEKFNKIVNGNHISMVKPDDTDHLTFRIVKSALIKNYKLKAESTNNEKHPNKKIPNIFIAYSHKDRSALEKLMVHLSDLERRNYCRIFNYGNITPGEYWDERIKNELHIADIFLLLVSKDFLDSDYINDVELPKMIEKSKAGEARVVPIIIRECLWEYTELSKFQAITNNGKPIEDENDYGNVVRSITDIIREFIDVPELKKQKTKTKKAETKKDTTVENTDQFLSDILLGKIKYSKESLEQFHSVLKSSKSKPTLDHWKWLFKQAGNFYATAYSYNIEIGVLESFINLLITAVSKKILSKEIVTENVYSSLVNILETGADLLIVLKNKDATGVYEKALKFSRLLRDFQFHFSEQKKNISKQDIIALIMQDEIDTAIKAIKVATNKSNDIILQGARWISLKNDLDQGRISDENAKLTKNRIVNGLLSITQKLPNDIVVKSVELSSGSVEQGSSIKSKQPKVFISYNHKDKIFADRIRDFFKNNNIPVTIGSEAMKAGEDINSFIDQSVRESDVTISLISTNSLMSAWVGFDSLFTLLGEQIAGKKFIPVAIEASFFNRSFIDDALDKMDESLNEINELIKRRIQENQGIDDLMDERIRYTNLISNLPSIIANLKNRLTIDISGDNFEAGMQRVLDAITS